MCSTGSRLAAEVDCDRVVDSSTLELFHERLLAAGFVVSTDDIVAWLNYGELETEIKNEKVSAEQSTVAAPVSASKRGEMTDEQRI